MTAGYDTSALVSNGVGRSRFTPVREHVSVDASELRLALFTDTFLPQVNGVSRTLDRLCNAIRERGGAVKVFTVSDPEATPNPNLMRAPSIPFWAYRELRIAWPSKRLLRKQLDEFRPNLIHVATPVGLGLAGRRMACEFDIPLVSSYHTSFAAYASHYGYGVAEGWIWTFLRRFHNSGIRTYCPTQAIVDEVNAHGFTNTAVWSRGVDATLFSPSHRSTQLRSEMGADDNTLVVSYVGRLAAEKGLDVATKAVQIAATRRPGKIVFSCVGDGPYEQAVRENAPRSTWLPGKLAGKKLSEAYASGDVFLFPSTTDTFGNVLLEAMASGLPIVGADVGPTRELVGDERGWLVKPGNAEAFAQVLVDLVDNPALRVRPRAASLEFAGRNSWASIWDRLIGDYVQLIKRAVVR